MWTHDIWAGAGLNKTSNGTKVGNLGKIKVAGRVTELVTRIRVAPLAQPQLVNHGTFCCIAMEPSHGAWDCIRVPPRR